MTATNGPQITGVSGHVGFRVLVEALARGHSVRAIIRKAEQAEHIKNAKSVQPHLKQLEISVIPDLLAPGAFDGALDGASGVVHVASPLPVFVGGNAVVAHLVHEELTRFRM